MPAISLPRIDRSWSPKGEFAEDMLFSPLRRFRNTQLRKGSRYTRAVAVLPLSSMAALWIYVVRWSPSLGISRLLAHSVTLGHILTGLAALTFWNAWLTLLPHTRRSSREDTLTEGYRLWSASLLCGALVTAMERLSHPLAHSLGMGLATTLLLAAASHVLLGSFLLAAALSPRLFEKKGAILIGTGPRSQALRSRLLTQYSQVEVFGCVDDEYKGTDPAADRYLGRTECLAELLKAHPVEVVIIGLPIRSQYDQIQRVIGICETVGVESQYMHGLFETARAPMQAHPEAPHEFSIIPGVAPNPMQVIKRAFDVCGALFLIMITSPLMLAAALAVRLTSPGPVIFVQQRYGRHRKRFPMFKFRSMVVDAEQRLAALESQNEAQGPVFKLKRDPRITAVGAFLRKTSIDELPQLFNVLRGEMSLVGPRPLPLRDVAGFDEAWLLRRFSVRPGLKY